MFKNSKKKSAEAPPEHAQQQIQKMRGNNPDKCTLFFKKVLKHARKMLNNFQKMPRNTSEQC